jgi:TonB family protein
MGRPARDGQRMASAWALSLAGHMGFVGAGALLFARSVASDPILVAQARLPFVGDTIEIELPVVAEGSVTADSADLLRMLPERGGGEGMARPDTGAMGRGGTDTSPQAALNLADQDDGLQRSADVQSRFDRSQLQRLNTSRRRASRENYRASREPMQLTFVASGHRGLRPERRPPADHDPSAGALASGSPLRPGAATLGAPERPKGMDEQARIAGGVAVGASHSQPGLGVRDGATGQDARSSAAVPEARPMVAQGTPSIPAIVEGRPQDTRESEQEVATTSPSIVHASTAGGSPGPGLGGAAGPGPTGSGAAAGAGSTASTLGTGGGPGLDNDPRDRRRTQYLRQVMAKIGRFYTKDAFPRWARAQGLQGTAVVSFVIRADGSVAAANITRPSGFAEFDQNCRLAVLRGAPFEPLPAELGSSYRLSIPFEASNPAVLPRSGRTP